MELFERLLSKDEINKRFIIAINTILHHKIVPNKLAIAESLGAKPSKFSEILNNRMKAGTDMIALLCDFYNVSPDWLLMSRGNSVFREDGTMPPYWIDDDDLHREPIKKTSPNKASNSTGTDTLLKLINQKDEIIRNQAEEIGKLKNLLEIAEREKNELKIASLSNTRTSKEPSPIP